MAPPIKNTSAFSISALIKLQQIFDLNPENGELIWKTPTVPQIKVGTGGGPPTL
jgi:hypothetical protein